MKRKVEQNDLLNFYFPSNPSFSPSGERIAYRVSRANIEKNGYDSDIWLFDTTEETNTKLTASGEEKFFCWSADGARLIFASGRKDARAGESVAGKRTVFWSIPVSGGEAERFFDVPCIAKSIEALDDHRYLLAVTREPEKTDGNPDMMVFEQVPFMTNGKGFTGQQRAALAIYDADTGKFNFLTPPLFDTLRFATGRGKTEALLVGVEYKDLKPETNAVYKIDLTSGEMELLSACAPLFTFAHAAWWNDAVVVTGTDRQRWGANENIKFYILQGGQDEKDAISEQLKCISPDIDNSFTNAVVADSHYGCSELSGAFFPYEGNFFADSAEEIVDGGVYVEGLVCCATNGIKSRLCLMRENGALTQLTFKTSAVVDYSVHHKETPEDAENTPRPAGGRIAFAAYEGLCPPELYILENGTEKRLTNFNHPLFDELRLSQPIHFTVDNGAGAKIDGWYLKPTDYEGSKKYPTILSVHGGPKAAFGDIYHHEMQCWASRGYAVIYCNPRGGDGRGSEFADIRGKYGEDDFHDIMTFTDWCVKNLSFVEGSRLGITGGSYGGWMTNWAITHTELFKAAVSQRGISNWVSKFGACDIGYYYVEDQHLGTPWRRAENPWRDSPLKYAEYLAQVKTPTLFVHSEEDFRCELGQGLQMFTALKVFGVESKLCVFKGENHELSRSGKPRNRLSRLKEIAEWFDGHL
ncbi:S9 family peptidase [Synergistales bacterium]|nr:S9 family peptidase [Synergistales bacterium]